MDICLFTQDEMGPAWQEVLGDRKLKVGVVADFGFADAQIAFMAFEDGSYEVGHGECLRPYWRHYSGSDEAEARGAWAQHVGRFSDLSEYELLQQLHGLID